jgi:hypothetical protein
MLYFLHMETPPKKKKKKKKKNLKIISAIYLFSAISKWNTDRNSPEYFE